MTPELIAAIKDHLDHGRAPAAVKAEVLAAGYTEAEWAEAYQAATGGAPAVPIPPAPTPVPTPAADAPAIAELLPTPPATNAPAEEGIDAHMVTRYIVGAVVLLMLGIGVFLWVLQPSWLTSGLNFGFLRGTPRDAVPAAELVPVVFTSLAETKSARLGIEFAVALAPREPDVVVFDLTELTSLSEQEINAALADGVGSMQQELAVRGRFFGTYDLSEVLQPNSDMAASLSVAVTLPNQAPLRMAFDGEARVLMEEGIFGRLNELDLGPLAAFAPAELNQLLGQWVELVPVADLAEVNELPSFQRELMVQVFGRMGEIVMEEIARHNVVQVTDVSVDTSSGERLYVYTYTIDYAAVPAMLRAVNARLSEEFGDDVVPTYNRDLERYLLDYDAVLMAEVGRAYTNTITLTPEREVREIATRGRFAFDERLMPDGQFVTSFAVRWSEHNEPITVVVPDVYLTRTEVEDVLGITAAREQAREASMRMALLNARSHAELYYNENVFSYAGFCASAGAARLFRSLDASPTCVDAPTVYRISVPLGDRWYCVDSTGAAEYLSASPPPAAMACVMRSSALESDESFIASIFGRIRTGLGTLAAPMSQLGSVGQWWQSASGPTTGVGQ